MYKVMNEPTPQVLAIRIGGKLGQDDYDRLQPWLKERLDEQKAPSLLVVMDDFQGWNSVGALVEDVKLDARYHDGLRKVALVGDRGWQKWMTRVAAPFAKADVRYFESDQIAQARSWLSPAH